MGNMRSNRNQAGKLTFNGVHLGDPAVVAGQYVWDDSRIPSGTVSNAGVVSITRTDQGGQQTTTVAAETDFVRNAVPVFVSALPNDVAQVVIEEVVVDV